MDYLPTAISGNEALRQNDNIANISIIMGLFYCTLNSWVTTRPVSQLVETAIRRGPEASTIVVPDDPPSGMKITCAALRRSPAGNNQGAPPSVAKPLASVTTKISRFWAIARDRANRSAEVSALTVASVFRPILREG